MLITISIGFGVANIIEYYLDNPQLHEYDSTERG